MELPVLRKGPLGLHFLKTLLCRKYYFLQKARTCAASTFRIHSKKGQALSECEKLRNIGIMAHIDAGKTTTTERMLYYAGVIRFPGEVHHGDTVTDFLPQERERGITIQSAVVSFPWEEFTINLIDTPGHVDFTFEVERSLRAVDSAVAIIDASAGVEAQTLTVWSQAVKNNLPRLIFLNKMDKMRASHELCLESIRKRLKSVPLLLQLPVYDPNNVDSTSGFIGVIDLVQMEKLIFDPSSKGTRYETISVRDNKDVLQKRLELVEQVSDFDTDLAAKIIETESLESVSDAELQSAIKRITLRNQVVPVLLGSSFKNIGVQPLVNAITTYLPHPVEQRKKDRVISAYGESLCCFVFKTLYDNNLGALTFLRVFRGSLLSGETVYNASREKREKILKIYQPLADDLHETRNVVAGQVAVITGLKDTFTGDTITSSANEASVVAKRLAKATGEGKIRPVLLGMDIPEPVFFRSIEPASVHHQNLLEPALEILQREDPSLRIHVDPETGQTVLSGMGELHLEIIHDRIKKEFKVDADMGRLQVAYKETILEPVTKRLHFERKIKDKHQAVIVELSLTPKDNPSAKVVRGRGKEVMENLANLNPRYEACVNSGVQAGLRLGPKLSFPVTRVEVALNFFEVSKFITETIMEAAAATCLRDALKETTVVLMEPFVSLEVTVDTKHFSKIYDDLNKRRFQMQHLDHQEDTKIITGLAPLADLVGYSTAIRTIASGLATFSMQFSHYETVMNPYDEQKIVTAVRGF